jgi:hypothetical protein
MSVPRTGALRAQLARALRNAYADGLLSDTTFSYRLELLLAGRVVDPFRVVGDLPLRAPGRRWVAAATDRIRRLGVTLSGRVGEPPQLLALDWDGSQDQLVIGRDPECDVVLPSLTVSRRHARLTFRDGRWILRDLDSTNGTTVNRGRIGRCELRPGDRVAIGQHELVVD